MVLAVLALTLAMALEVVMVGGATTAPALFPVDEMDALHSVFVTTGGSGWAWRANLHLFGSHWNFSKSASSGEYLHNPCIDDNEKSWQGVMCSNAPLTCANQTCHVTGLRLFSFNLQGPFPVSLSKLTHLQNLWLFDNPMLTGTIPPQLGQLVLLQEFIVYDNALSGPIPVELGQLDKLINFDLSDNNLNGSIPTSFGQLSLLNFLSLYNNVDITGPIPSELGQLVQLEALYLSNLQLTGSIPAELFGNMVKLQNLYLNTNYLTGPIPTEICQAVSMVYLYLYDNLITGPIPTDIGQLVPLQELSLHSNFLTSSIPTSVGQLTNLKIITCVFNMLSGVLPTELGQLSQLQYLSLFTNHFEGSLPPELGLLSQLLSFQLSNNFLTGTIPTTIGQLSLVDYFGVDTNRLTGPLPSEFGLLINLEELHLYNNMLQSTIPVVLNQCTSLLIMRLENNKFFGKLEGIFTADMMALENLDLSDNNLSGNIPQGIFDLPSINTIALSLNCFEGTLPHDICSARNVSVLAMDGLGAASNCKNAISVPLSGVSLFTALEGSIPPCVWALPLLQVLHMTGNGFTGTISETLSPNTLLKNVAIAHNKISGTIPISIQQHVFDEFDLSYNKLTGKYSHYNVSRDTSQVLLEINRLSGRFPSTANAAVVPELSVLRSNLFTCGSTPDDDEYSDEYTCGSAGLNMSLYITLSILGLLMMLVCCLKALIKCDYIRSTHLIALNTLLENRTASVAYVTAVPNSSSRPHVAKIHMFGRELYAVAQIFGVLMCLLLATSIPIYSLKLSEYGVMLPSHTTHSYQYLWLYSVAYLSGSTSLALILVMWFTIVATLTVMSKRNGWLQTSTSNFKVNIDASKEEIQSGHTHISTELAIKGDDANETEETVPMFKSRKILMILLFLANIIIVGAVDGLYIHATSQSLSPLLLVSLQSVVALFKVLWNMVMVPSLVRPLQAPATMIRVELLILIFNNVLLPCVVTAFTSPACFQGLLVDPDEVTSSYSYQTCVELVVQPDGSTDCFDYTVIKRNVAPLIPPFSYNNMCSSVFLTNFIPVYIFVYSIQFFTSIAFIYLFLLTKYSHFPKNIQPLLPGIFWPEFWKMNDACDSVTIKEEVGVDVRAAPEKLLRCNRIVSSDVLYPLLIFVSFGLCSPLLAVILTLSVCVKLYMWILFVGRFVSSRKALLRITTDTDGEEGVGLDSVLLVLNAACSGVSALDAIAQNIWLIVFTSAVFFAFLCWDILGDEVGWENAVWAPLVVLCVPFFLYLCLWLWKIACGSGEGDNFSCSKAMQDEKLMQKQ